MDSENNDPKQRICQPKGQIQHTLESAKSVQDANGMLAAEDGLLKAWRDQAATETRGLSAQRSEPNAQLPQLCAGMAFHAPAAGEQQQPQKITTLWRRMLGFMESRGCGINSRRRP
ncbi:hypothetical protein TRVL_09787 [Trypanosoma vivax]|nr:hypothetical protein TRVL_09787 [Trypanosoma vivax]